MLIDSIQISKLRLLFFSRVSLFKYGCCEMLNEFGSWREVLALFGVIKGAEEG